MAEEANKSPLEHLAELLEMGTAEERSSALDSLASCEGVEPLILLIKAFNNSMWVVRRRASEVLAKKGAVAVPFLEQYLNNSNDNISYWSIRTLAGFGQSAVKPLRGLLTVEDRDKRLFAITALGETAHPSAVEPLLEALGDTVWSVRKAACAALVSIGKVAVPSLRSALHNPNINVKYWSVKALGKIMGKDAVPALSKTLGSKKQEMRYYGVVALGETGSEEAVPYLVGALEDKSWVVRQHAAKVLREMGEKSVPHLIKGFETGSPDLKYWVIKLVGKIMGSKAVTVLIRFLKTDDDDLRYYAVTALGETEALEAVPLLINSFGDRSWVVRRQASEMLSRFGAESIPALEKAIASDNEDIVFWAIRTLGMVGDEGIDLLQKKFNASDKRSRLSVLEAIAKTGSSLAIRPLVEALGDEFWPVRKSAADILKTVGERCVPHLLRAASSENADRRYWSKVVLSSYGVAASDIFIQVLKEGSEEEKLNLLDGFGEFTDPAMAQMLVSVMEEHEGQDVRRLISRFLAKARGKAVEVIIDALKKGDTVINELLSWAVGEIASFEMSLIIQTIKDQDAPVVACLLPRVADADDPSLFALITKFIGSDDRTLRSAALQALAKRKEDTVDELLLESLEKASPGDIPGIVEILDTRPTREDLAAVLKELGMDHEVITAWIEKVLQTTELIDERELWKQVEKQREEVDRQLGGMAKADAERYIIETDLESLKNVPYHNLIKLIGNVLKIKYGLIQNVITQTDEESLILAAREFLLKKDKLGPVDVHKWVQAHARSHHYLVILREKKKK